MRAMMPCPPADSGTHEGCGAADPDGEAVTLTWAFDDGATVTGEHASHAWTEPGTHIAMVTATDPTGLTDSHTFLVDVQPNPNHIMALPTSPRPGFAFPDVGARPKAVLAAGGLRLSKTGAVAVRLICHVRRCKGTVALALAVKRFATASFSSDAEQTTTTSVRVSRVTAKSAQPSLGRGRRDRRRPWRRPRLAHQDAHAAYALSASGTLAPWAGWSSVSRWARSRAFSSACPEPARRRRTAGA
jgi:hypothetical protein